MIKITNLEEVKDQVKRVKHTSARSTAMKGKKADRAGQSSEVTSASKVKKSGKRQTKKAKLIQPLSKSNGARLSVLAEKLEWQTHTVRAALSGLRKEGFELTLSKSAKSGEAVYAIRSGSEQKNNSKPRSSM